MTESPTGLLDAALPRLQNVRRLAVLGRVTRVIGQVIEASAVPVAVGEVCRLSTASRSVLALVAVVVSAAAPTSAPALAPMPPI